MLLCKEDWENHPRENRLVELYLQLDMARPVELPKPLCSAPTKTRTSYRHQSRKAWHAELRRRIPLRRQLHSRPRNCRQPRESRHRLLHTRMLERKPMMRMQNRERSGLEEETLQTQLTL